MEENNVKDEQLWQIAERRAKFKKHLVSYLSINAMMVVIWYITYINSDEKIHFWPIWSIAFWGIGLVFDYTHAYFDNSTFSVDAEYEKLKKEREQKK